MSCSVNKLKSQMLFTCKKFILSNFAWKFFFSMEWLGEGGESGAAPSSFSTVLCKVVKIIEKYLLRSSIFLQAEGCNFTKSEPLHRYFSRIFVTFLKIIAIFISPYLSLSLLVPPYLPLSLP